MTADSAVAAADAAPERGYENLADLEAVVSVKSEATSEEAFSDAGERFESAVTKAVIGAMQQALQESLAAIQAATAAAVASITAAVNQHTMLQAAELPGAAPSWEPACRPLPGTAPSWEPTCRPLPGTAPRPTSYDDLHPSLVQLVRRLSPDQTHVFRKWLNDPREPRKVHAVSWPRWSMPAYLDVDGASAVTLAMFGMDFGTTAMWPDFAQLRVALARNLGITLEDLRTSIKSAMKPSALRVYNAVCEWLTQVAYHPAMELMRDEMLSLLKVSRLPAAATRQEYVFNQAIMGKCVVI